eukprot:Phypoly_transcript_18770.p1 GENE.Phypoly_transcript_18770~~Phypoly_transcript_18770.p1  ORF type:complete len:212 (+),score=42.31 Phypoly_transcript_18770:73-708(+)
MTAMFLNTCNESSVQEGLPQPDSSSPQPKITEERSDKETDKVTSETPLLQRVLQADSEKEIKDLKWQIFALKFQNAKLEDQLAKAKKPTTLHATKLQALTELVEELPQEYQEELKREINFDPNREFNRCLTFVNSMCHELRESVDWYVDKLEQKLNQMDMPDMVKAMQLAAVPDDVIDCVTNRMTTACCNAENSVYKWKDFSDSLRSICLE